MYKRQIEECVKAIRTMLTEATEVDNNPAEIYWFSQISGYYLWAMLELYSRNYDQAIIYAGKVMEAKGGYDVLGESVYSKFWGDLYKRQSALPLLAIVLWLCCRQC